MAKVVVFARSQANDFGGPLERFVEEGPVFQDFSFQLDLREGTGLRVKERQVQLVGDLAQAAFEEAPGGAVDRVVSDENLGGSGGKGQPRHSSESVRMRGGAEGWRAVKRDVGFDHHDITLSNKPLHPPERANGRRNGLFMAVPVGNGHGGKRLWLVQFVTGKGEPFFVLKAWKVMIPHPQGAPRDSRPGDERPGASQSQQKFPPADAMDEQLSLAFVRVGSLTLFWIVFHSVRGCAGLSGLLDFPLQVAFHKLAGFLPVRSTKNAADFAFPLINHAPFAEALRLKNLRAVNGWQRHGLAKTRAKSVVLLPGVRRFVRLGDHDKERELDAAKFVGGLEDALKKSLALGVVLNELDAFRHHAGCRQAAAGVKTRVVGWKRPGAVFGDRFGQCHCLGVRVGCDNLDIVGRLPEKESHFPRIAIWSEGDRLPLRVALQGENPEGV